MVNSIINKFSKWIGVEGTFTSWFVILGILTQLITYYIMEDTVLSVCSGIAGVISVVLCSQKKYAFYFWSFLQIATFVVICFQEQFYGKIFENLFYTVTMVYGLFIWNRNIDNGVVKTRILDYSQWYSVIILTLVGTLILYISLILLNSTQPFMDSITSIFAIVAQILMILRFKESWYFWLIVDILCFGLFISVGNYCMTIQYLFWTLNCIYGIYKWN